MNFLEYEFEQLEKDYLLYKRKPDSILDAVNRYNEIDREISKKMKSLGYYSKSTCINENHVKAWRGITWKQDEPES